jgi:hypothetical protein
LSGALKWTIIRRCYHLGGLLYEYNFIIRLLAFPGFQNSVSAFAPDRFSVLLVTAGAAAAWANPYLASHGNG